jgi:rubrerythrin
MVQERGASLEERLKKLIENLSEMKRQLEDIALDEMSEAHAYAEMAKLSPDPDTRWVLFLIAADSIVHREIVWSLVRAVNEIQVLARELLAHPQGEASYEKLMELVKIHKSIEEFAESSYAGLVPLAEPGTTLRKLLEMLVAEEEKHHKLVESTVERLRMLAKKEKEESRKGA